MIDIYIFCIIIKKFNYKKKLSLIILLIVDKSLNISFYNIIQSFNLTINLEY